MIIDLGSGVCKIESAIGVDINPEYKPDIVHDLNNSPYPFESNVADRVYAREVIEHLSHPWVLVSESHRILKPGGLFFVTMPNVDSFTNRIFDHWDKPYHISLMNMGELETLLRSNGFEIVQVKIKHYNYQYRHRMKCWWPRRMLSPMLPENLREQITVIARKAVA